MYRHMIARRASYVTLCSPEKRRVAVADILLGYKVCVTFVLTGRVESTPWPSQIHLKRPSQIHLKSDRKCNVPGRLGSVILDVQIDLPLVIYCTSA